MEEEKQSEGNNAEIALKQICSSKHRDHFLKNWLTVPTLSVESICRTWQLFSASIHAYDLGESKPATWEARSANVAAVSFLEPSDLPHGGLWVFNPLVCVYSTLEF